MLTFWQNNSLIQILDEQDYPMTIPFREAFEMTRKLVVAQEKALGIQRSAVQLIFIDLPDQPESFAFQRLAKAIGNVASFRSLAPETRA